MIPLRPLWIMVAMLSILATSRACDCPVGDHPQNIYCNSDFVLKVKVISSMEIADNICYTVIVRSVFKADGYMISRYQEMQIYTVIDTSYDCGTTLLVNGVSLITGYIDGGGLYRIDGCGFSRPWSDLTRGQKRGIRNRRKRGYGKNCDCTIIPCSGIGCAVTVAPNQCSWDTQDPCYMDNWACRSRSRGCVWTKRPLCI